MKQFFTIFKHELSQYFKNKIFVITTLILILAVSGFLFAPRIGEIINKSKNAESSEEKKSEVLVKSDNANLEKLLPAIAASFPQQNVKITNDSIDEIKKQIKDQSVEFAFVLSSNLKSYTYLANVSALQDPNLNTMDNLLKTLYSHAYLKKRGLNDTQIAEVQNPNITHTIESISEDGTKNFWYAYVMVFVLYMVIMMFGQKVAMSVVTEKTSRAMEVLITSASPVALMFGKILASSVAGIFQITAIFGSAFISYNINKSYFETNAVINTLFNFPASLVGYLLIFFLLGFLIYSFLFGAMASTVSKIEDLSSVVMLIQIIFVAGFVVSTNAMTSGDVNSELMKGLSLFPLTSPMAMFTRIAMSEVPGLEILLSVAFLILATILIGYIAAKIYRVGVLMYGTKPTLGKIIKAIREN
ncbi:ABC transporter permease [Candidatus Saccharibacteria bacterium]|nr:ABC transporter permease [Candidatus Saccharibacteria bacterium]